MKHVAGLPNSAGTRITVIALLRLQSRRSGVTATEQINTRAVSIHKLLLSREIEARRVGYRSWSNAESVNGIVVARFAYTRIAWG